MPDLLASGSYGVTEDGPLVKLHAGTSTLPMSWDIAIRMSARLRIAIRNAQEYIGMSRVLASPEHEVTAAGRKLQSVRESSPLHEGGYRVFAIGPDVILEFVGAKLTMEPGVARNISQWLDTSGRKVQAIYAPDVVLHFHVAQLTDANAVERDKRQRLDSTAAFQA